MKYCRNGLKESGITVRGVCGSEESTQIAYTPLLMPAYLLTDLDAIIDMQHGWIAHTALNVKQQRQRLESDHVPVSIVEFGIRF